MGFRPRVPFITVLERLGLTNGLKLCLDAGDSASYTSGQPWLDRSGNGYDFNRGATSASEGSDPTFNGSAGGLSTSEYFSLDGGDYFRYDSANETWMNNIHKDGAIFTYMAWIYPGAGAVNPLCGTNAAGGSRIGFMFRGDPVGDNLLMHVTNGTSAFFNQGMSSAGFTAGAWHHAGISYDETLGSGTIFCDTNRSAFSGNTYSAPSASNATYTMEIGARGNANSPCPNGARFGAFMFWEGVSLTAAQIASIYDASHSFVVPRRPSRSFTQRF